MAPPSSSKIRAFFFSFPYIFLQDSTNQAFLFRNWTNGGLFDSMLLQKMQGNAKNALILLLLGGPFFMGHPVLVLVARFLEKLNILLCDEGSKNVYFVEIRKIEGQKPPGHTSALFIK